MVNELERKLNTEINNNTELTREFNRRRVADIKKIYEILRAIVDWTEIQKLKDLIKNHKDGEKSGEVLRQHSVVNQQIKAEERFDSVPDSKHTYKLGLIRYKNSELIEYIPSDFIIKSIKEYTIKNEIFTLYGYIYPQSLTIKAKPKLPNPLDVYSTGLEVGMKIGKQLGSEKDGVTLSKEKSRKELRETNSKPPSIASSASHTVELVRCADCDNIDYTYCKKFQETIKGREKFVKRKRPICFKPKEVAEEKEPTFELIEKYIPPRGITCKDCMRMGNNEQKIEKEELEWLIITLGNYLHQKNIEPTIEHQQKRLKLLKKYIEG